LPWKGQRNAWVRRIIMSIDIARIFGFKPAAAMIPKRNTVPKSHGVSMSSGEGKKRVFTTASKKAVFTTVGDIS